MADPVRLDMICRCSPEGAAEADALVAKVREEMLGVGEGQFVSALVMELNWQHGAFVELAADQWFGVRVLSWNQDGSKGDVLVSIECDRIEDGLAACYDYLENTKKPGQ